MANIAIVHYLTVKESKIQVKIITWDADINNKLATRSDIKNLPIETQTSCAAILFLQSSFDETLLCLNFSKNGLIWPNLVGFVLS